MQKLVFILMPLLVFISCGKSTKESEEDEDVIIENAEYVAVLDESNGGQTGTYPETEFTDFAIGGNVVYLYRVEEYNSNIYDVWVKAEPLEGEYFEFSGVKFSKHVGYHQIHCKSNKYDTLEYHTYDVNGEIITSNSVPERGMRMLPESPIEVLRDGLCSLID